ncbi:DUF1707 domain-containing protein [Spirillospora sp. NPDC047279]|uniref:DUF1707 SHOCT-like domain-containing protein n=1 Tax=Spirillospora sp. NPDC047279 TaxID=3155478 RepID=UPI0033C271A0
MRPDEIRIGDAERDAVTSALHDHFAAGRLDQAELGERLDSALTAKTQGDLRTVVRDLPGDSGLEPVRPSGRAHRGHPPWAAPYGGPHAGHPSWAHAHRHAARRHHRPGFPMFPLMLVVFFALAFTAGPATAFFAVFQLALLVWIVRAVMLAAGHRAHRR